MFTTTSLTIKTQILFGISLFFIILTAWTSIGFYHEDEHFQILEFMAYKLGLTDKSHLAWEFEAQLRPWMQIGIYYSLFQAFSFLGVEDRFTMSFIFRVFTGAVAWISLLYMAKAVLLQLEDEYKKWVQILLVTLTGYIPYIMVRTSGESLSTSFFLIGLALIITKIPFDKASKNIKLSWYRLLLAGLCFGFAFEFKYQSAVLTFGILLWLLFVSRRKISDLFIITIGGISVLVFSIFVNRWGYGEWTLPVVNYFEFNLLSENKNQYGDPHPFFGYLYIVIANLAFPMVIVYLTAMFFMWFRNRSHILTWVSLGFFLIHCIIENKQIRFMFPLAVLAPFYIFPAFYPKSPDEKSMAVKIWNWRKSIPAKLLYFWNIIFLITFALVHMWSEAHIANQKYIYYQFPEGITYVNYGWDPYYRNELKDGKFELNFSFYKRENVKSVRIKTEDHLLDYLKKNKGDIYLFASLPKIQFKSKELQKNTHLAWSMIPFHDNQKILDFLFPTYEFVGKNLAWIEFPGFYKIRNFYHNSGE